MIGNSRKRPPLDDCCFAPSRLKLLRTSMANRRMPPLTVIKNFNVLKDITFCLCPCLILNLIDPLPFEGGKETFRHRVIVAIAWPTHATGDPVVPEKVLEIITGILAAAIGVMNEAGRRRTSPQSHRKGFQHQEALQPSTRTPIPPLCGNTDRG